MSNEDVRAAFDRAETLTDPGSTPRARFDDVPDNGQDDGQAFAPYDDDQGDYTQDDTWRGDLPPDDDQQIARAAAFPLNDFGNGQRLMEYFGQDIVFVPRLGWNRWNGRFWQADEDALGVRRDAQKIAAHILAEIPYIAMEEFEVIAVNLWDAGKPDLLEIEKVKEGERSKEQIERLDIVREYRKNAFSIQARIQKAKAAHRGHARTTGNSGKIDAMIKEGTVEAATTVDALNANDLAVNCQNGVVIFAKSIDEFDASFPDAKPQWRAEMVPHDREFLISKMMLADYDLEAKSPQWLQFLETIQPDLDVREFLQRWFGLSITGIKTEQKLAFFHGSGRNGKSTMVDLIARIMSEYATTIPIDTLTGSEQRKGSDATPDLVRIPGSRLCRASEPEEGQKMKEALIKQLTGGEAIMIRRMQQEFVEIVPQFKLTISGNSRPEVHGSDDGIWRRILLVPFAVQIEESAIDENLSNKLWAERDGIFAWLVRGCLDYLQNGLQVPDVVRNATAEYRADSDQMRVFLLSECEITGAPGDFVKARDLGDAYNAYVMDAGGSAWGSRRTSNQLKMRSHNVKGPEGQRFEHSKKSDTGYTGIQLKSNNYDRIEKFALELKNVQSRRG